MASYGENNEKMMRKWWWITSFCHGFGGVSFNFQRKPCHGHGQLPASRRSVAPRLSSAWSPLINMPLVTCGCDFLTGIKWESNGKLIEVDRRLMFESYCSTCCTCKISGVSTLGFRYLSVLQKMESYGIVIIMQSCGRSTLKVIQPIVWHHLGYSGIRIPA